ncbi:MAG: hypothetical protein QOJ19_2815 [Acidimicrobiia bacterium]|jgi:hypothetical protein|nr:hypothetical protein [Acidimicrobiia bacterium]
MIRLGDHDACTQSSEIIGKKYDFPSMVTACDSETPDPAVLDELRGEAADSTPS